MDCGGVIAKYVLFVFNMICVICGILLIVLGATLVSTLHEYNTIHEVYSMNKIPISIIALGCVIFFISFLGCYGAIRENACCTFSYSAMMLVLFILQVPLIVILFTKDKALVKELNKAVDDIWAQRSTNQTYMDDLQLMLKCCGANSPADYKSFTLPASCCGKDVKICTTAQTVNTPGCKQASDDYWEKNIKIVRNASLGIGAIELVAFIFACCLGNSFRNNPRGEYSSF